MSKEYPVNRDYVVRIQLTGALSEQVRSFVQATRDDPENEATRTRGVELLHEAVESNLNFYLLIPARQLRLNSFGIKLLNMGAKTVLKLILSVGHKLAGRMSGKQMLYVADFVEEQLLSPNGR